MLLGVLRMWQEENQRLAWFKKGSFWVTKTIEDLPSFL